MKAPIYKVATLPGTLAANALYYVQKGDTIDVYATNNVGLASYVHTQGRGTRISLPGQNNLNNSTVFADILLSGVVFNQFPVVVSANQVTLGAGTYLLNLYAGCTSTSIRVLLDANIVVNGVSNVLHTTAYISRSVAGKGAMVIHYLVRLTASGTIKFQARRAGSAGTVTLNGSSSFLDIIQLNKL